MQQRSTGRSATKRWLVRFPRAVPVAIFLLVAAVTVLSVFAIEQGEDARAAVQLHGRATGIASALDLADGDSAEFTSQVTFTSPSSFQEIGSISFGHGTVLHFTTVGSGFLGPSADPTRQHGAVMWRVERGEGQLAGATGLITSNFFVGQNLEIVDHHFGVLLID